MVYLLELLLSQQDYPQYSEDGGVESERTYIKQLVQKFVDDGSSEDLFNEDEIETANV